MGRALSLLIFAAPTLLVCAARYVGRNGNVWARRAMLVFPGLTWLLALWFWVSYGQQQDDVGLMVQGILAFATSASALLATLVALFFLWRG